MNQIISIEKVLILWILILTNPIATYSHTDNPVSDTDTFHKKTKVFERPWPASPYSVRLGAFVSVNNMEVGAGTNNNPYSVIDFENDLGMSRNTYSALFNFNARFKKHNRIDFSYYNIYRKASATIKKDIQFGDHEYPVDSDIKAFLNTNIFRLSYGYSFVSNKHMEFGALVGFHVMSFNIGLDFVGNTQQLSFGDDVKFTAPLPDFGLWGTYAFHNRWAVSAEASYFDVVIDGFSGRILSGNISLQYKLNDHWGVDLGYTGFDVKVNLDRRFLKSEFNWSYGGPLVNVSYRFGRSF